MIITTTRREFLEIAGHRCRYQTRAERMGSRQQERYPIPTLARIGGSISMIGIDGFHLGKRDFRKVDESILIIRKDLDGASDFPPMSAAEVSRRLAKTAQVAESGRYELYKTSHHFDGTYQDPRWLG